MTTWFKKNKTESLDIHQAKTMLEDDGIILVDIRDPNSFNEAHIQGALRLSDDNIEEFVQNTDKATALICYCYQGISSLHAVEYFKSQGFANVYNLSGGFEAWRCVYPCAEGSS